MTRKVHAAALADLLKSRMPGLEPPFRLVRGPQAKVLEMQRRMSFCSVFSHGMAFVPFQPAATAVDDYLTVDLAWLRSDQQIEQTATVALSPPGRGMQLRGVRLGSETSDRLALALDVGADFVKRFHFGRALRRPEAVRAGSARASAD